ncbi:heme utilization or adhesion related exo protein [Bifidobacterium italicum]|uniref:Heme utilization or adhesion related exo protein n=1 Tax=Bifidobacterium italicum TaxID=1960968 RepID=A0A2A2ELC1_9BIFI|nr:DUF4878 domain-containing protein [Bifidobacterium italicum]PAU69738.1 heme utilization or adhesion related exo protein [Bifidobacterium italicum]
MAAAPQPATPKAPVQVTPQQLAAFGTSTGVGLGAAIVMALFGLLISWSSLQNVIDSSGMNEPLTNLNFFHRLGIYLALGNSGSITANIGSDGGLVGSFSIMTPLSWIGYALAIGCAFGAFLMARKATIRFRWVGVLSSFAVGIVSGLVMLLLTAIMRYSYSEDSNYITLSGATFRTFALVFILATLGALIGYFLADTTADESNVFTAAWTWAHRVRGFRRTVVESAACYVVVSTVVALIIMIVTTTKLSSQGGNVSALWAFLPVVLPALSAWNIVIGSFGAIEFASTGTNTISISLFSSDMTAGFDYMWALWLMFVLYLLCGFYVALRAAARNAYDPYYADWRFCWQAPVFWLAFWLITPYLFMGVLTGASGVGTATGMSYQIVPALWFCLIAALWSFIIEVVSRLLGPTLIQSLPGIWPILVGGTVRPGLRSTRHDANEVVVTESMTMATPSGVASATETFAVPAGAVPTPGMMPPSAMPTPGIAPAVPGAPAAAATRKPMSPKTKMWLIIGGVVVGLIIVLSIVFSALNSSTFSASATAKQYIAAIESGDFNRANSIAKPQVKNDQMKLLSNNAAPKDGRISNAQVIKEKANGNSKIVTVSYTLDGKEVTHDLKMIKRGSKSVFFTDWGVAEPMTTTIHVAKPTAISALDINGVEVTEKNTKDADGDAWSITVYPGTYSVSAGKSKYLKAKTAHIIASGDESSPDAYTEVAVEATDALTEAIQQKVNAKIDECEKSTDLEPKGCPFSVYSYGDDKNVRNFTWSVTDYPQVQVDTDYGTFQTDYGTEVKYTYERKDSDGWEPEDGETTMSSMSGTFSVDGDKLTVEISDSDD